MNHKELLSPGTALLLLVRVMTAVMQECQSILSLPLSLWVTGGQDGSVVLECACVDLSLSPVALVSFMREKGGQGRRVVFSWFPFVFDARGESRQRSGISSERPYLTNFPALGGFFFLLFFGTWIYWASPRTLAARC